MVDMVWPIGPPSTRKLALPPLLSCQLSVTEVRLSWSLTASGLMDGSGLAVTTRDGVGVGVPCALPVPRCADSWNATSAPSPSSTPASAAATNGHGPTFRRLVRHFGDPSSCSPSPGSHPGVSTPGGAISGPRSAPGAAYGSAGSPDGCPAGGPNGDGGADEGTPNPAGTTEP